MPISNSQPQRVTIIAEYQRSNFHVIADRFGKLDHAELCFDEMLGALARMFRPTFSDGKPNRGIGQKLFLSPPEPEENPEQPKHPDAAGDNAPQCSTTSRGYLRHKLHRLPDGTSMIIAIPQLGFDTASALAEAIVLAARERMPVQLQIGGTYHLIDPKVMLGEIRNSSSPFTGE
jgi:hypothetical protein